MKKQVALLWFLLVALTACKKENDVQPYDSTNDVIGTYAVNRWEQSNQVVLLPITNASGEKVSMDLKVRRSTRPQRVDLTFILQITGEPDDVSTYEELEVRGSGNALTLWEGSTQVGTADGRQLTIDTFNEYGERVSFLALKK
ncbi:hypothetical protein [Spirosoma gilvum]